MDSALEQIRPDLEKAIAAYGRRSIGICLGSCDNGSEVSLKAHRAFFEKGEFPEGYDLRFQSAAFPAEYIARKFGIEGPAMTIATACASGASALVRGAELIQAGVCDAVIAGGVDIVSETVFLGFHSLEVFSAALTNPFSKERKGINLGEGAAFFLLCREDPGRGIELFGAGESADAFHMTTPGPDGEGPARAMKAALLDAGLEAEEIAYVNLHGTGTIHNDRAEALAMKAVFKDHIPPSSSTKPITGHTLGASGALEAAICWMVLETGKGLPLHCWDGMRDETIPFLPLVPTGSGGSSGPPGVCMSNNFAFGGCNVSLILGRRTRDY
jgi:3-oxoacyl-[acyl-carrier-protein] synthase-1